MEKSFQTNMTYASAASKCVGTCDNGLGINLIEAGNREADDTAVGILDVRLACINLPAVNKTLGSPQHLESIVLQCSARHSNAMCAQLPCIQRTRYMMQQLNGLLAN